LRDLPLPPVPRYAVQSAKLRPVEAGQDPALVTLTLRASGEVRVVHGNKDVHDAVSAAVREANEGKEEVKEEGEKAKEDEAKDEKAEEVKAKEGEETKEEEKEDKKAEGEEAKKADEAKEEEKKETPAGVAEPEEKDGLWKINLQPTNAEGAVKTLSEKERVQILAGVLKRLIGVGWEVLTTGELTVTEGYELFTWILKKSTTPLADAEVAAIVLQPEGEAKVEVVSEEKQPQVNNALKRALENTKDENGDEKDDPECAFSFELGEDFGENDVPASRLVLELSHLLFCRQWKLVATAPMPGSRHEVLFYCRYK